MRNRSYDAQLLGVASILKRERWEDRAGELASAACRRTAEEYRGKPDYERGEAMLRAVGETFKALRGEMRRAGQ